MSLRGQEWEDKCKNESNQNLSVESANKVKFRRNLKELDRLYNNHSKSAWSTIALASLERCLGEIVRAFSKSVSSIEKRLWLFRNSLHHYILFILLLFCFSVHPIRMLSDA